MLDEFRSTYITWDKATSRIYSPVTANASDSNGRKLNIQVVNSGQVENLTGATLHLYWETKDKVHDGLDAFDASDISKGEFEIFYTTGMLSNVGELNATLVLVDSTGKVVSDWFKITVTRGINEGAIESENSFSSLTQALIDISNLEQNYAPRLNDLTAQLQQKAEREYVDERLNLIGSAKPSGAFPTLTDLETTYPTGDGNNFYVVTSDNNWYYWNDTSWVAGGLFNATVSDGFPATNKITNGDFENTSYWGSQFASIIASNNVLTATLTGDLFFGRIFSSETNRKLIGSLNSKVYVKSFVRVHDDVCKSIDLFIQNATVKYVEIKRIDSPQNGVWYELSNVVALPETADGIALGVAVNAVYDNAVDATGKTFDVKNVLVLDLTETFGVGKEPNLLEINKILELYPSGWFDGTRSPLVNEKFLYNTLNESKMPYESEISYDRIKWGNSKFRYVAHRGYYAIAPENSIPAMEEAGKAGYWGAETDVNVTKDGNLILMHDSTVDRTTDGTGAVRDLTLSQIQSLNIDTGANIAEYPNLKVPTFEEYLIACKKWGLVPFIHIEQFPENGEGAEYDLLMSTLINYGFEKTCIIAANGLGRLNKIRSLSNEVTLLYFTGYLSTNETNKALALGNCAISFNPNNGELVQTAVEYAHAEGIHVGSAIVNDSVLESDFLIKGVDFIITDTLNFKTH